MERLGAGRKWTLNKNLNTAKPVVIGIMETTTTTTTTPTIYVLALEGGRYYVGATDVLSDRVLSHFTDNGSAWTHKHKPVDVLLAFKGDAFDEDKLTKLYMHKHGIENVRGASYCRVTLTKEQISSIEREFATIDKKCFQCGETGHFVANCVSSSKKADQELTLLQQALSKLTIDTKQQPTKKVVAVRCCARCGRNSHNAYNCYARTTIDGDRLWSDDDDGE